MTGHIKILLILKVGSISIFGCFLKYFLYMMYRSIFLSVFIFYTVLCVKYLFLCEEECIQRTAGKPGLWKEKKLYQEKEKLINPEGYIIIM